MRNSFRISVSSSRAKLLQIRNVFFLLRQHKSRRWSAELCFQFKLRPWLHLGKKSGIFSFQTKFSTPVTLNFQLWKQKRFAKRRQMNPQQSQSITATHPNAQLARFSSWWTRSLEITSHPSETPSSAKSKTRHILSVILPHLLFHTSGVF